MPVLLGDIVDRPIRHAVLRRFIEAAFVNDIADAADQFAIVVVSTDPGAVLTVIIASRVEDFAWPFRQPDDLLPSATSVRCELESFLPDSRAVFSELSLKPVGIGEVFRPTIAANDVRAGTISEDSVYLVAIAETVLPRLQQFAFGRQRQVHEPSVARVIWRRLGVPATDADLIVFALRFPGDDDPAGFWVDGDGCWPITGFARGVF
jgi:hypothetical protein